MDAQDPLAVQSLSFAQMTFGRIRFGWPFAFCLLAVAKAGERRFDAFQSLVLAGKALRRGSWHG